MAVEIGDFSTNPTRRWKRLLFRSAWLYQALGLVFFYSIWVLIIRFLSLTFITYFTHTPSTHFQDVSDIFSSNEVSLMGFASFAFVLILYKLYPLSSFNLNEIISREKVEKNFLPGFLRGAALSGVIIIAFLLCGFYRYLGYFIQLNEAPLEMINIFLRMATLAVFTYCEEFIFRNRLPRYFRGEIPPWLSAQVIAVLYCGIKVIQFDLGIMHVITLYLISMSLFFRAEFSGQFARGAGYWAAVLIVLQPLVSLPIFGNDFTGILLLKYQGEGPAQLTLAASNWFSIFESRETIHRFFTGGTGGPISSFVFQLFLILDISRSMLKKTKA